MSQPQHNARNASPAHDGISEWNESARKVMDALTDHICVLDTEGKILTVNRAWREFAATNPPLATNAGVGANYFAVCEAVVGEDAALARKALKGFRSIAGGGLPEFKLEYSCHSPGVQRWFEMRAARLEGAAAAPLIVMHQNITERKRLEAERGAALARLRVVEGQERQRLSRELHDQTAQRLVALAVDLKTLEANLAAGRPQADRVQSLRRAVDDLHQQVRQIAWDLHSRESVEEGLEDALGECLEEWAERVQVYVDFECQGLGGGQLSAVVEATLYRAAQEALANVEKHAQARRVSVLLQRGEGLARLTVEDDGRGFDVDAMENALESTQRLGLLGMKDRVALAGGTLLVESSPGAGTTILVRIPIPNEAEPS